MRSALKPVLVLVVLLALGAGQVMGVIDGFFCPCSGQISIEADCDAAECHAEVVAVHCGDPATAPSVAVDGADGEGSSPRLPCREHEHQQVRTSFRTTPSASHLSLPPMVWTESPTRVDAAWDDIRTRRAPWAVVAGWVNDGGASAALMVARTVVRRI